MLGGAWPVLRSFELDIGGVAPDDLLALFKAKLFPSLETLRLGWIEDTDHAIAVATLLRKSTLFEQLQELVITGPLWGNKQETLVPVVAKVLAGTHVTVTLDGRDT